ncbi:MAG TPA: glycoside hydrolase family 97 catalytic domain-containing protein [Niastella sp.]
MRRIKVFPVIGLLVLAFATGAAQTRKAYKVTSPDKSTSFEIQTANGQLMYRMVFAGEAVTNWSPLGLQINGGVSAAPVSIKGKQDRGNKEKFAWPLGETDTITNNYNEIRLSRITGRVPFQITARVYDGSVAFRYELPASAGVTTIQKELTGFNFTTPYTLYQYHHESVFTPVTIDTFNTSCDFPATLTNNRLYLSVGEACNTGYTKAELKRGAVPHSLAVAFVRDSAVQLLGDFVSPWRTISVSKTAIGLHDCSQLYLQLNPPADSGVPAWIKPGKLIRSQLNTQSGLDCIDFAASHHFQYIMFDAGWYGAEFRSSSDPTQVIPQIDMPKVIQYGKEKGIGVVLYVNYVGLKAKLDTILPLYKQWGVAGLKFGFVDGFTQQGLTWLHAAIKKVNDFGFILNIHDNYKPTGLSRTYPALLTQEGIRGDENSPDAFHTTTLPFTRFLAGPADFTFCYPNAKNKFTKNLKVSMGQQLALTVVYCSPLQAIFWYGQPNDYTNEKEIDFFKHVPTVWNESRYLAGDIGKNISVARRSGDTWYVGNAAGFAPWKTNIKLHFLATGKTYKATIYEDDGKESIRTRVVTVKKGDVLPVSLAEKTGNAIIIEPVTTQQKSFIHPGILHTQASLDHIYAVAQQKILPGYGSYLLLRDHPLSASQYKMNGPYKVIARDGEYRWTKSKMEADFSASYLNALMWVATKDAAHARTSWEILESYADSLTSIPATNDAPLLAGLEGVKIINALEILRYTWPGFPMEKAEKVNTMIRRIFLPVAETFYRAPAYTNGNWGPIVTKMYMSAAIWFNNDTMYRKATNFYCNGHDNGTIRNYINAATGQIQESGRDQGHCQLGIGALATVCEIAWNQGDDLYGAFGNRLLKGFEYVAKYNLGNEVPFLTWKDVTGKYSNWTTISAIGRGRFIPVYEMVYNHFVRIKKLSMPYTEQVIQKIRPEGYDRDQPAFGTLLFWGVGEKLAR